MKQFLDKNKGNTMIIVALSMVILFGCAAIAVDAGYIYTEKAKLQTAADAAAIAGAYQLYKEGGLVDTYAHGAASANGVQIADMEVTPNADEGTVTVEITQETELFFARALGFGSADIYASAVAKALPPTGVKGLMPIGIDQGDWGSVVWDESESPYRMSQEFVIKVDSTGHTSGNFHAVDFTETKKNMYEDRLAVGYDGYMKVGDEFSTETGNKVGPTLDGIFRRLSLTPEDKNINPNQGNLTLCDCESLDDCPGDCPVCSSITNIGNDGFLCPRVGIVPVLDIYYTDINGNTDVRVKSFAAVFITNIVEVEYTDEDGKKVKEKQIYAKFIDGIITPEGEYIEGVPHGDNGVDVVKLID